MQDPRTRVGSSTEKARRSIGGSWIGGHAGEPAGVAECARADRRGTDPRACPTAPSSPTPRRASGCRRARTIRCPRTPPLRPIGSGRARPPSRRRRTARGSGRQRGRGGARGESTLTASPRENWIRGALRAIRGAGFARTRAGPPRASPVPARRQPATTFLIAAYARLAGAPVPPDCAGSARSSSRIRTLPSSMAPFTPRPFRAPLWARNRHVQTLAGKFLRPAPDVPLRRERWATPDGDELLLDFCDEGLAEAPMVLLLHGLEGSARRPYALLSYRALRRRGLAAVGMNFRSCGGEANRLARSYHSGETGDPRWVLERLRERWPQRPLGAIGFSLGGNVLLKLLGDAGDSARALLGAAAAVSVPFDLSAGSDELERGPMVRAYSRHFLRSLVAKVVAKGALVAPHVEVDAVRAVRTMREFDHRATAPLHGFAGAAEYYAACSSAPVLEQIRVRTLVLHSRDDPFLPRAAVPEAALAANPALVPVVVDRGGHVGFVEGPPWAPRFWAEEEAARFLAEELASPPAPPSASSPRG
ncbi:MAG: alpha/beta fold hydrolase [Gemmatimonadetes bacterium]|nr:alpha/beta fold hydrolase [Gemmatimonadota bacterium]